MQKELDLDSIKAVSIDLIYAVPIVNDLFAQHPFTQSSFVSIENNTLLNLTKEEDFQKWVNFMTSYINASTNFDRIYYLVTNPYKLTFLKYVKQYMTNELFSHYLSDAYMTEEFPSRDKNVSRKELIKWFKESNKQCLMNEYDYKKYMELPNEIIVYRGVDTKRASKGLSWTLDRNVAIWFSNRFKSNSSKGIVLKANVTKDKCLAYFNERNEREIVVDTRKLEINILE